MAPDTLRRWVMNAEKVTAATVTTTVAADGSVRMDEMIQEKAHKCPELKSVTFNRNARLTKGVELLADFIE